ncbi:SDR family NAD(P)-dependent oxidoreductase [Cellulosimicrobium arenosum]|uniref:SDR family NAD(P)-dependent oxidoreductase n=1 Tax=Cellulosimicrobium arenosum TaxID=2708133 RepID=A0A927J1V1_9MICO|nr:SDR family NAD(P)-dependent oxidoreductase [Cellulosimicrobium arenosum]
MDLDGRTALVTGSAQGIGLAIARTLADCGASVVVNGRSDETSQRAAADVRAHVPGADVRGVAADLATDDGAAALLEAVPGVDVLVNNLGIFSSADPLEIDDAEWRRFFEVDVLAGVRASPRPPQGRA